MSGYVPSREEFVMQNAALVPTPAQCPWLMVRLEEAMSGETQGIGIIYTAIQIHPSR
jgi:hypothetical protein